MSKSEVSLTSTAYNNNYGGGGGGGGNVGRLTGVFTRVCVYRGRVYAVKRSPKDAVDITRALKKELKVGGEVLLVLGAIFLPLCLVIDDDDVFLTGHIPPLPPISYLRRRRQVIERSKLFFLRQVRHYWVPSFN